MSFFARNLFCRAIRKRGFCFMRFHAVPYRHASGIDGTRIDSSTTPRTYQRFCHRAVYFRYLSMILQKSKVAK